MTPKEILIQSKQYLKDHGWHQGSYESPSGAVCARGALFAVAKDGRLRKC